MKDLTVSRLQTGAELLAIWRNPIVWKNFKSRMRIKALFPCLVVLVISAFMTLTIYTGLERFEGDSVQAARTAILPLGVMQWLILMLSATGRISSGLIHERVTGTIDYTRLTPMSPMTKVLGYLFGLPVREYICVGITMPFMVFLLIVGEIPLSVTLPVYAVFFTSALLYHLIGTVFGLVLKEWRMSVVFTIGIVVVINLILPLFSNIGFPFLEYLTIRPVVIEKIFPYLAENSAWRSEIPEGLLSTQVDFFNWKISTTLFTLLVQGSIIFTLGLMVYRKWQNAFSHSLSKLYAIGFFIGLQLFCIGTLWPNLVLNENSIFNTGLVPDEVSASDIAFFIPMFYSLFLLLCVFWLLYVVTPTRDEYRSGLLKARKLKQTTNKGLSRFDDNAGSLLSTAILAACCSALLVFVQATMSSSGALESMSVFSVDYFKLPLAIMLIVFYFYLSLEYLELNKFALLFLCLWIVPILLAVFLAVAFENEDIALYIASVSPIILTVLSVQGIAAESVRSGEIELVTNAYWIGSSFMLAMSVFLGYRLKTLQEATKAKIQRS